MKIPALPTFRPARPQPQSRRAFTLIELLVVISIIAVLAGLLMAALGTMGHARDRTAGMHNIRQVGMGFLNYAGEHNYEMPGRVNDGTGNVAKWPAVMAGYSSGTYDPNTDYLKDVRVLVAPGYSKIDVKRADLASFLTANSPNNTSWTMNGYNDIGAKNDTVEIRLVRFAAASNTILLGMHRTGLNHFYMDFDDGDNKSVVELRAYEGGSNYVFADGSVRYITEKEYNKTSPTGKGVYGDWLWLADKSNAVPE